MAGLYVPLVVNYFEDVKIIRVGPLAELLYVRSLAFCKRSGRDGAFTREERRIFAARLPRVNVHTAALVLHSLWTPTDDGWYITAWFNHNVPESEIRTARRNAGMLGNHRRWHLPPDGTPSSDCKFCIANVSQ